MSACTCATSGRSSCTLCMQFERELWDAIYHYAAVIRHRHVYGDEARMQAASAVNAIVARVTSRQRIDDVVIEDLVRGQNAAAAAACSRGEELAALRAELRELDLAHEHLSGLYAESRELVGALSRERDALAEAANRAIVESDRIVAELGRLRPVYEAAGRMRDEVPVSTASEMRLRGFHPTTCDLIEQIDRARSSEPETAPYRGSS